MVFRKKARRVFRGIRRFTRRGVRKAASNRTSWGYLLGAAGYGALRNRVVASTQMVWSKIPAGNLAPSVLLGTAAYFGAKKLRGPMKEVATAVLTVEAANVGASLAQGGVSGITTGGNASSTILY